MGQRRITASQARRNQFVVVLLQLANLISEVSRQREGADGLIHGNAAGAQEEPSRAARATPGLASLQAEKAGRIGLGHQVDFCLSEPLF